MEIRSNSIEFYSNGAMEIPFAVQGAPGLILKAPHEGYCTHALTMQVVAKKHSALYTLFRFTPTHFGDVRELITILKDNLPEREGIGRRFDIFTPASDSELKADRGMTVTNMKPYGIDPAVTLDFIISTRFYLQVSHLSIRENALWSELSIMHRLNSTELQKYDHMMQKFFRHLSFFRWNYMVPRLNERNFNVQILQNVFTKGSIYEKIEHSWNDHVAIPSQTSSLVMLIITNDNPDTEWRIAATVYQIGLIASSNKHRYGARDISIYVEANKIVLIAQPIHRSSDEFCKIATAIAYASTSDNPFSFQCAKINIDGQREFVNVEYREMKQYLEKKNLEPTGNNGPCNDNREFWEGKHDINPRLFYLKKGFLDFREGELLAFEDDEPESNQSDVESSMNDKSVDELMMEFGLSDEPKRSNRKQRAQIANKKQPKPKCAAEARSNMAITRLSEAEERSDLIEEYTRIKGDITLLEATLSASKTKGEQCKTAKAHRQMLYVLEQLYRLKHYLSPMALQDQNSILKKWKLSEDDFKYAMNFLQQNRRRYVDPEYEASDIPDSIKSGSLRQLFVKLIRYFKPDIQPPFEVHQAEIEEDIFIASTSVSVPEARFNVDADAALKSKGLASLKSDLGNFKKRLKELQASKDQLTRESKNCTRYIRTKHTTVFGAIFKKFRQELRELKQDMNYTSILYEAFDANSRITQKLLQVGISPLGLRRLLAFVLYRNKEVHGEDEHGDGVDLVDDARIVKIYHTIRPKLSAAADGAKHF